MLENGPADRQVSITREAFEFIANAARNTFPSEFAGLLRKNKSGAISEILVIPQTINSRDFSSVNLYNVPYTSHHCGSVHSHPGSDARPSRADLAFFKATGEVHIIIAHPFILASARAYDSKGNPLAIKVV